MKTPQTRIHIEAYCQHLFPEHNPAPAWNIRLNTYYEGTLAPFALEVDESRLEQGKKNDFLTMSRRVMQELEARASLRDVGLFMMAHQTLDTFYPYRSTPTLLCHEFAIDAPVIDITERELTAPYIALKVLLTALENQSFEGSGVLLVLDQATLPYKWASAPSDSIDNALGIKLMRAASDQGSLVEHAHYWHEDEVADGAWATGCIQEYLKTHALTPQHVHVVTDATLLEPLAFAHFPQLTRADPRFMSCAGLRAAIQLRQEGAPHVLLAHLSPDNHLYLFLFLDALPTSNQGSSCST